MEINLALPSFGLVAQLYLIGTIGLLLGYFAARHSATIKRKNRLSEDSYHNGDNALTVFWNAVAILGLIKGTFLYTVASVALISNGLK